MGLRINTNIASLNAQRNLAKTQMQLERSLDGLSSGLRITRAGDDVVRGWTLEVISADLATTLTVRVEEDQDSMVEAIAEVVTAYNDVVSLIGEQAQIDPTTNRGGPLIGDATPTRSQTACSRRGPVSEDPRLNEWLAITEELLRAAPAERLAKLADAHPQREAAVGYPPARASSVFVSKSI